MWVDDLTVVTRTQTKDYSEYGNDATINSATWTDDGVVGGAYVFDGKNDYMRIGDDPSLGGDGTWSQISLEFWIKPTILQNGGYIIAKKDPAHTNRVGGVSMPIGSYVVGFRDSGTANTLFWGINNGTTTVNPQVGVLPTTGLTYIATRQVLPVNKWSHVVLTYKSGTGMFIYINGTLRAWKAQAGNIAVAPGTSIQKAPLYIGYDGGSDQSRQSDGGMYRYRWLSAYPRRGQGIQQGLNGEPGCSEIHRYQARFKQQLKDEGGVR